MIRGIFGIFAGECAVVVDIDIDIRGNEKECAVVANINTAVNEAALVRKERVIITC